MLRSETIELCVNHAMNDFYQERGNEGIRAADLKAYIRGCGGDHDDFVSAMGLALQLIRRK